MTRRFASPDAFKWSIEDRLAAESRRTGERIERLRQWVVFDRFLARLHRAFPERMLVKGGVVLELRLASTRATKDIDASITGSSRRIGDELLDAFQQDLYDYFLFTLARDRKPPDIEGDAVRYGGGVQFDLRGPD